MFTRTIAALLSLTLTAGLAAAQTKVSPQIQTAPAIQAAPKLKLQPNLPALAVGKRVVRGLDFAAQGLPPPATPRIESRIMRKVDANHSALILYGTVNMGDTEYFSVSPVFQTQYQMFSDRPGGCQIDVVRLDQTRESDFNYGYKHIYRFWDTGTKKECGDYFANLKTIELDLKELGVRYVSVWQRPQVFAVANPGVRTITLPPIEARHPSGEE